MSDRHSQIQFDTQRLAEESVCALPSLSACKKFFERLSLHIVTESGVCKIKCYPALLLGSNENYTKYSQLNHRPFILHSDVIMV